MYKDDIEKALLNEIDELVSVLEEIAGKRGSLIVCGCDPEKCRAIQHLSNKIRIATQALEGYK